MSNLRLISSRIINDVTEGRSLSDCLESKLPSLKDSRDRGFVQAVCYGVCRFYPRLDLVLSHLLKNPMREQDSDVHALLMAGLYQLMFMRIPDYAAVTETVNASEKLNKPWARGLINAILREYLRRRDALEQEIAADEEANYAHPDWWIHAMQQAYPDQWQSILNENNQHPPFALRVNQQIQTRDEYLEKLKSAEIAAHPIAETRQGIILESAVHMHELPGFAEGEVSVQDGGAQLAADYLELAPDMRVLDACAAPGGKLTHLLEIMPLEITAVEKDKSRMSSIEENLQRLKLSANCICADVIEVKKWWDGKLFDRILLDAPCSASGVVRRHPDIKLLRYSSDIPGFVAQQKQMLAALWPLLKPEGLLLYITCSVFPEENTKVIEDFLKKNPDAKEEILTTNPGISCPAGKQILPGMNEMDGFYYALIRKLK